MKRWIAVLTVLAAGATAIAIAIVPTGSASAVAATCQIRYTVTAQWSSGFIVDGTIKNLGQPVNGWTLRFTFPDAGQVISLGWMINLTQTGRDVTGTNPSFAPSLTTGGSIRIGFNGGLSGGPNPVPTAFTLNGLPCLVSNEVTPAPV